MKRMFNLVLMLILSPGFVLAAIGDSGNDDRVISKENNPDFNGDSNYGGGSNKGGVNKPGTGFCTEEYAPVCAFADGKYVTFSNSCKAGNHKIISQGTCEDSDVGEFTVKPFLVDSINDGFSVNVGFSDDQKRDFKIKYYEQGNSENFGFISFENRDYVGAEIHSDYSIPTTDSFLPVSIGTTYIVEVLFNDEVMTFGLVTAGTDNSNDNSNLVHGNGFSSLAIADGNVGESCEAWLNRNNIVSRQVKTYIHEDLLSSNFGEVVKSNNCIYKIGDTCKVDNHLKAFEDAYPVSYCQNKNSAGQISNQYFMRVKIDSNYYNSLDWKDVNLNSNGNWGESCYEWLDRNDYNNYEVRTYDKYGVLPPTICAYELKKGNDVSCLYGGADGNFKNYNDDVDDIRPVKSCNTNVLTFTTQVAEHKKIDINDDVNNDEPICKVIKIDWLYEVYDNSLSAEFEIETENCIGQEIDLKIMEKDFLIDDEVETISVRIFDEKMNSKWTIKNLDDGLFSGSSEVYLNFENLNSNVARIYN